MPSVVIPSIMATMESLLPGSSLGRYQILEQIGRGGMASVFRAHDPNLDRDVAVKVLPSYITDNPTLIERFTQEAHSVARLVHPNIITVHDFGDDKGFTYIVMEHVTGGTLSDRLTRRLTPSEALEFITPLAAALDYAHGRGIVHRDVKPSNVLLAADGNPILSDFGLARMLEGSSYLTGDQSVIGTADYMAPEQALGRPANEKSDLYALGVVIYQMLLGQTPFHADTPSATLMAHIHQPVPRPTEIDSDLDPRLEVMLFKALAKDPNDRFDTASHLRDALGLVVAKGARQPAVEEQPTAVGPVAGPPAGDDRSVPEVEERTAEISLHDARLLAIQHVRENIDFYGSGYAGANLVWEVISEEDIADHYEVRLTYRPAGRFRGKPGVEQITIGRSGSIELRRILYEPVVKREVPFIPLVAAAVAGVLVLVTALVYVAASGGEETAEGDASSPLQAARPGPTAAASPPAAAIGPPSSPSGAARQAGLAALTDRTLRRVAAIRGLQPIGDVTKVYLAKEALNRRSYESTEALGRKYRDMDQKVMEILGVDFEGTELFDLMLEVFKEMGTNFYFHQRQELYISVDSGLPLALQEVNLAHAMAHALLEQHFQISERLKEVIGGLDAFLTLNSLLEGDATVVQTEYAVRHLTPQQQGELIQLSEASEARPIFQNAPYSLRRIIEFIFNGAVPFVKAIRAYGGWEAVNRLYEDPPGSTEQLLHPEKYIAGEMPVPVSLPDLSSSLGPRWVELQRDVLGELSLLIYLETQTRRRADAAAAGWGGDQFSLLRSPTGEEYLVALIAWDTPDDAREFFDIATSQTDLPQRGSVNIAVDRVLMVVGPSPEQVSRIKALFPGF